MAVNISKKIIERFSKNTPKFKKALQSGLDRDINESDTVAIITDILADVFGYDKYEEITSEFAINNTYCDLAIRIQGKIQFLIEAKAIGINLKDNHLRQASGYAANHGIEWVILSNGIEWFLYKMRFEQPISMDLVCSFNFLELNLRDDRDKEYLFLLSKEGLSKSVRDDFYDKIQCANKFIVGALIESEPVLNVIRRELRKFANGLKIEQEEVQAMIHNEVLKRELIEGDSAKAAKSKVKRFYKKQEAKKEKKEKEDSSKNNIVPEPVKTEEANINNI